MRYQVLNSVALFSHCLAHCSQIALFRVMDTKLDSGDPRSAPELGVYTYLVRIVRSDRREGLMENRVLKPERDILAKSVNTARRSAIPGFMRFARVVHMTFKSAVNNLHVNSVHTPGPDVRVDDIAVEVGDDQAFLDDEMHVNDVHVHNS